MPKRSAITFLAGGRSRRMGTDKASLEIDGKQLLLRNVEDAIKNGLDVYIASSGTNFDFLDGLDVHYVDDFLRGKKGPLSAITGALQWLATNGYEGTWVMPTDQLILPSGLLQELEDIRAQNEHQLLYFTINSKPQPLFGWYPTQVIWDFLNALNTGIRNIVWIADLELSKSIDMPQSWHARYNFNTPDDIKAFYEQKDIEPS